MHVKEAMELFAKQFPQTALLVVSLFGKEIPEQFEIMPSSSIGAECANDLNSLLTHWKSC
jgi:hypothetical protein